ncbi:MAG: tRNA pseudouridine(54/55) synthase Pus10, partial [Candidatus Bathyarchaeia archaeon]
EELIAEPIIERTLGEEGSFHGAGREDIDALMLGRGRPFVIEIKKPHKRRLDLSELEKAINQKAQGKIAVTNLKVANKEEVRKLKHVESSMKLYRVVVKFDKEVSNDDLEKLERAFTNVSILQRTPRRVMHRRADIMREKHIYETKVKRISQNSIEMKIRCQGGLYIKELVTGDEGRTDPNVSKIVNAKAEPIELDVLNVFVKGGGI